MTVHLEDIKLGIVCPMANESQTAESFVREVLNISRTYSFKSMRFFAILDDACQDDIINILRTLKNEVHELEVVYAPENRCVVDAYVRGYREALDAGCDWILEMDAGYGHNPADIPRFFDTMQQGYQCVFGSRFCKGGSYMSNSAWHYLVSRGGTILSQLFFRSKLSDLTSGFELFSHQALNFIMQQGIRSRGRFFQTEVKIYAHQFHIAEVPIQYKSSPRSIRSKDLKDSALNFFRLFWRQLSK